MLAKDPSSELEIRILWLKIAPIIIIDDPRLERISEEEERGNKLVCFALCQSRIEYEIIGWDLYQIPKWTSLLQKKENEY